jgi:hypothetical protein
MHLYPLRSAAIVAAAIAVALAAAPFHPMAAGVAHAGEVTQTLNVAVLTPCCGSPEPNASGSAQATVLVKPDLLRIDSFSASVTIPHSGTGVANTSTADIRLVLSRAGADYAECFLVLVDDDDLSGTDDSQDTFLVNVVKAKVRGVTIFRQFAGTCDVDLTTPGVSAGVPAVQAGDVVTASSVANAVSTPFLQGTFVQQ